MNIKKARVILLILIICSINMVCPSLVLGNENITKESITILIDPGHGGIDSGAISKDGTMEKEINLKISNKLKDNLLKEKFKVVMTREKDEGLYTNDGRIRKKKVEDLNNRCELKKSTNCNMFISIHLNMFPQPKYYGAQVWYSKNENSKKLAYILQKNLVNDLDKNNNRKEKAAKNCYKVLRCEDTRPSVLIECGFLSNVQEKNKLITDEYQSRIADSIARSVKEYYSSN